MNDDGLGKLQRDIAGLRSDVRFLRDRDIAVLRPYHGRDWVLDDLALGSGETYTTPDLRNLDNRPPYFRMLFLRVVGVGIDKGSYLAFYSADNGPGDGLCDRLVCPAESASIIVGVPVRGTNAGKFTVEAVGGAFASIFAAVVAYW